MGNAIMLKSTGGGETHGLTIHHGTWTPTTDIHAPSYISHGFDRIPKMLVYTAPAEAYGMQSTYGLDLSYGYTYGQLKSNNYTYIYCNSGGSIISGQRPLNDALFKVNDTQFLPTRNIRLYVGTYNWWAIDWDD